MTRQARQGREALRQQRAEIHRRIGETQHATEQLMLRVAGRLPDPDGVRRRAREPSERGDRHLRQAEQESSASRPDEDG